MRKQYCGGLLGGLVCFRLVDMRMLAATVPRGICLGHLGHLHLSVPQFLDLRRPVELLRLLRLLLLLLLWLWLWLRV